MEASDKRYKELDEKKKQCNEIQGVCFQKIQSNLNTSNTNGSFIMADWNSFLSPYEILMIAPENKYLRKFSYFIMKLYVVCTH